MTWKCSSCGFDQNNESNLICICGFRDSAEDSRLDRPTAQKVKETKFIIVINVLSFALTLIVYLQIFRSFFIRTREEAMMFKLIAESFSFAPLSYVLSLTASILKKRNGHSGFGLAETALLASLPLAGVFTVIHSPRWYGANIQTYLLFRAVEFFLPSIAALVLLVWIGRHRER